MRVIKIGGSNLEQPGFSEEMARTISAIPGEVVLVHGGGKEIDELQIRLGIEPMKVDGMRVTDAETLRAAMMILCGLVNKQIVAALVDEGLDAIGLCGVDAGLIRVQRASGFEVDLGYVGEIVSVRDGLLRKLLDQGITPVISPISLGLDGQIYNVNSDQVASALASALGAQSLDFVTDVPGILRTGSVQPNMSIGDAERLIESKEIREGMIPKVHAGVDALSKGVPNVRFVNLPGLVSGSGTTLTTKGAGTTG